MNWEKFWLALGVEQRLGEATDRGRWESWWIGTRIVGKTWKSGKPDVWTPLNCLDPHDPGVPLEVLLDGLEGLDAAAFVCPCAGPRKGYNAVRGYDWETGLICWAFDRREAAIDAICVLAGIEQEVMLTDFERKLLDNQQSLPPEITEGLNDNWPDLLAD